MKAYKGFDKDLKCRGEQFKIGEEKSVDGDIVCCQNGYHACEAPLDVFEYYSPATSRYCEVEQSGDMDKKDNKTASRTIKVGAEIGIAGLVKAHFEYVKSRTTTEHTDPKMATAGDSGAATAGDSGAATAGSFGAATAGYSGAATAGDSGAATAGYRGAATAGYRGAATAGDSGAATAGDSGAATSRGSSATGKNGLSVARGNGVKVKGGVGAVLVIAVENDYNYDIKEWKAGVVDGEIIKADTWYTIENGEFVEVVEEKEEKE